MLKVLPNFVVCSTPSNNMFIQRVCTDVLQKVCQLTGLHPKFVSGTEVVTTAQTRLFDDNMMDWHVKTGQRLSGFLSPILSRLCNIMDPFILTSMLQPMYILMFISGVVGDADQLSDHIEQLKLRFSSNGIKLNLVVCHVSYKSDDHISEYQKRALYDVASITGQYEPLNIRFEWLENPQTEEENMEIAKLIFERLRQEPALVTLCAELSPIVESAICSPCAKPLGVAGSFNVWCQLCGHFYGYQLCTCHICMKRPKPSIEDKPDVEEQRTTIEDKQGLLCPNCDIEEGNHNIWCTRCGHFYGDAQCNCEKCTTQY